MRERLRRLRRLPHGRGRDRRAASAAELLQRAALQRRLEARGRRRPVLVPVPRGRRRARRPLHLPARRRPLPDGHQRRQPRHGLRVVRASTPRTSTPRSATPATTTRCSPSRARRARELVGGPRRRRAARARCTPPSLRIAGARGARLRHRLHGRGRRRAAARPRTRRRGVWDALLDGGRRARPGSAPATRCGSRSASTCTATTWAPSGTRSRPASAGAARRTRASSARRRSRGAARRGPGRAARRRSCSPGAASRARATRCCTATSRSAR